MSEYAPGAPAQIWALAGLTDGAKLTLLWWWSKADHEAQRSPRPCTVWARAGERADGSRMTPAESLLDDLRAGVHPGKPDRTLRGYIAELRGAGLVAVDGRCVDLVPPSEAEPRREPAADRRKSAATRRYFAGENPPQPGEISPCQGENQPTTGEISPDYQIPPYPPDPPVTQPLASEPEPGDGSPMQAEQTALGHPRKTRVRRKAQPELPLDDAPAEPDPSAELLALHQRLRSEALAHHGIAGIGWPGKLTGAGRSLAHRVGKALAKHGPEACTRYIEHRAAEWREDAGPLVRYPPDQTWSPKIVDPTIARLTGVHARASPGRASPHRLSAPQATHAHSYEPPETETCDL